jgi:hypothetical protein
MLISMIREKHPENDQDANDIAAGMIIYIYKQ